MNFLEKIKSLNRKWAYLLISLVIIGIGSFAIGGFIHSRDEQNYERLHPEKSSPIYRDLIYLENTVNLKISLDQANAILPLIGRMATADKATRITLSKNVYGQLTPQQLQSLLNKEDSPRKEMEDRHEKGDDNEYKLKNNKGYHDILEQSLPDATTKMLKDIIMEQQKQISSLQGKF